MTIVLFRLYVHQLKHVFVPLQMKNAILDKDEKSWEEEYTDLPSAVPQKSKDTYNYVNMTDFSIQKSADESTNKPGSADGNFSIGQYFRNRCDDIRTIIPNVSPKKKYKRASILPSPNETTGK